MLYGGSPNCTVSGRFTGRRRSQAHKSTDRRKKNESAWPRSPHLPHFFFLSFFFFMSAQCGDKASRTQWKVNTRCEVNACTGGFCQGTRRRSLSNNLLPVKSKQRRHRCACVRARGQLLYHIPTRMSQHPLFRIFAFLFKNLVPNYCWFSLVFFAFLQVFVFSQTFNLVNLAEFHFCQMANLSVPTESLPVILWDLASRLPPSSCSPLMDFSGRDLAANPRPGVAALTSRSITAP